jgi:flagellar biogenesis protein FliO
MYRLLSLRGAPARASGCRSIILAGALVVIAVGEVRGQDAAAPLDFSSITPEAFQAPQARPVDDANFKAAAPFQQKAAPAKALSTAGPPAQRDPNIVLAAAGEPVAPAAKDGAPAQRTAPRNSAPLPISHTEKPKPLASAASSDTSGKSSMFPRGLDSLLTVLGSLGIVLGLFVVVAWCLRKSVPKSGRSLPVEVMEVLGRAPLSGRQQVHLIRFGGKLVLVTATPNGVDAISEITDPQEVDRIAGYCEEAGGRASFRGILDRLETWNEADEPARRPNRTIASMLGSKHRRTEDEYV